MSRHSSLGISRETTRLLERQSPHSFAYEDDASTSWQNSQGSILRESPSAIRRGIAIVGMAFIAVGIFIGISMALSRQTKDGIHSDVEKNQAIDNLTELPIIISSSVKPDLSSSTDSPNNSPLTYDKMSEDIICGRSLPSVPKIPICVFDEAIEKAFQKYEKKKCLEMDLISQGIVTKPYTPPYFHQLFLKTHLHAKLVAEHALITEYAASHLKEQYNLTSDQANALFSSFCYNSSYVSTRHSSLYPRKYCDQTYKYRSVDGTCNNIFHQEWGSAFSPYRRLLPPDYADGISEPRRGHDGDPLPSARKVSSTLYEGKEEVDCNCTLLTMLWGLIVDHDITSTASTTAKDGNGITCCAPQIQNNQSLLHPACFAIEIPSDDYFFKNHNQTCMEFVRSSPVALSKPGPRQQLNQITSYLDGSAVYGSTEEHHCHLRRFSEGKMKISVIHGTPVLPKDTNPQSSCGQPQLEQFCFHAGDDRANEQVFLTTVHTIMLREHNRVADQLFTLNPHWGDERIFQEARQIVAAELQHITYNEYLPIILGENVLKKHGLLLQKKGYYEGYDPNIDATSSNVFATSAFRFGHSQVKGVLQFVGKMQETITNKFLHQTFLNPETIYEEGLDIHTRGMITQRAKQFGSHITQELRNHLFQPYNGSFGLDLAAFGIQRGRDHGLPSYVAWRRYCNLSNIGTWDDLAGSLVDDKLAVLKKLYQSPKDIDLTPGALSEHNLPGALVGPTHACLIAEQFKRLRKGDRFWYENSKQSGSFSLGQLEEIRKTTLARILCDNSDDFQTIQKNVFLPTGPTNILVNCSDYKAIPQIDLMLWKDHDKSTERKL